MSENIPSNVINRYFSKETDISNDIRRALLTIGVNGKYEYYEYWWSFWYVSNANKRCLIAVSYTHLRAHET